MSDHIPTTEQSRDELAAYYKALFEQSAPCAVLDMETGVIRTFNSEFCQMIGYSPDEVPHLIIQDIDVNESQEQTRNHLTKILREGKDVFEARYRTKNGELLDVIVNAWHVRSAGRDYIQGVYSDISNRKKIEAEREELVGQLQKALAEVKTLRGLLPICVNCKKIHDTQDHWVHLEAYLREHTEADFTHGYCPECYDKVLRETDDADSRTKP